MVNISQFVAYEATFSPVRTDDLKPGFAALVGKRVTVYALWVIDENDGGPYVGDWAMGLIGDHGNEELIGMWIPSRELTEPVRLRESGPTLQLKASREAKGAT